MMTTAIETLCDFHGGIADFNPRERAQVCARCWPVLEKHGSAFQDAPAPSLIHPGVGVTHGIGSDRYAYTVIAVDQSASVVVVQSDLAVLVDGNSQSESQSYRFERHRGGSVEILKRVTRGRRTGQYQTDAGGVGWWRFFGRDQYRDPSF